MRLKTAAVLMCAFLVECESPFVVCGCEPAPPPPEYTVSGRVLTVTGIPIPGAVIVASEGTARCALMLPPNTFSSLPNRVTGSDGSFAVTGPAHEGCLRLIARHPTRADSAVKEIDLGGSLNQRVEFQFP